MFLPPQFWTTQKMTQVLYMDKFIINFIVVKAKGESKTLTTGRTQHLPLSCAYSSLTGESTQACRAPSGHWAVAAGPLRGGSMSDEEWGDDPVPLQHAHLSSYLSFKWLFRSKMSQPREGHFILRKLSEERNSWKRQAKNLEESHLLSYDPNSKEPSWTVLNVSHSWKLLKCKRKF